MWYFGAVLYFETNFCIGISLHLGSVRWGFYPGGESEGALLNVRRGGFCGQGLEHWGLKDNQKQPAKWKPQRSDHRLWLTMVPPVLPLRPIALLKYNPIIDKQVNNVEKPDSKRSKTFKQESYRQQLRISPNAHINERLPSRPNLNHTVSSLWPIWWWELHHLRTKRFMQDL